MSGRIEVGMLVRITSCINKEMMHHVGKIGRVYRECVLPDHFKVSGCDTTSEGRDCAFHECRLEPIRPDSTPSTWEEVQKLTNWNPTKVTA